MNYLGHVAVALAAGRDDDAYLLGAALPDLASMVGVRVDRALLPVAVADGVGCHLAVDEVFHAHPIFREGSAALRADLRAIGLATGPTRAIGHAGWELLLDGSFVGGPVEAAYRSALDVAEVVLPALPEAHRPRWERLLTRRPPPPLRYDDPAWVAERLFEMLDRRPRLALDRALVPEVVGALSEQRHRVGTAVPGLLQALAAAAASPGRRTRDGSPAGLPSTIVSSDGALAPSGLATGPPPAGSRGSSPRR